MDEWIGWGSWVSGTWVEEGLSVRDVMVWPRSPSTKYSDVSPYSVRSPGSALTVFFGSQPDGSQGFAETFLDTALLLFPAEREKFVVVGIFGRHTVQLYKPSTNLAV